MNELYHYGVLGMKWGVRKDRRSSGSRSSSRSSAKSASKVEKKRGLSDSQKRALKIGAAVAVTALAAYGGYKLVQANPDILSKGKAAVDSMTSQQKQNMNANFDARERKEFEGKKLTGIEPRNDFQKAFADQGVKVHIPESRASSIKNVNPSGGMKNCTACSVAYTLRRMGIDATAKNMPQGKDLLSVVDDCFKGAKSIEGTATTFGKSPEAAKDFLVRKFGDNAKGVVGVTWQGGKKHAFSFEIENGEVIFSDGQNASTRSVVENRWRAIDPQGQFKVSRLDNATPNVDGLRRYVNL